MDFLAQYVRSFHHRCGGWEDDGIDWLCWVVVAVPFCRRLVCFVFFQAYKVSAARNAITRKHQLVQILSSE